MMKKILYGVFLVFLLISTVNASGIKPTDFQFFHKKIGIALNFSKDWEIYADEKNAPDFFKETLRNRKDKNDSPLFVGMKKNQSAFSKLTVEKYEASLDDYVILFKKMLESSKIALVSEAYSADGNTATIVYQTKVNNLPIRFVDYIVINNGYAVRLDFWSLDSLFNDQVKDFTDIAKNGLFFNKVDESWNPLWANVPIPSQPESKMAPNDYKYMFFSVKGKTNNIFIMGSIHIGKSSFYPFPEKIETAFSNTPNIVVEINTKSKEFADKVHNLNAYAYLGDNKTLKDVLSNDLYAALKTNFANYGLPMEKVYRLKPWVAASTLVSLKMMSLGYVAESGTEKYFLDKAENKNIFELESFEEQSNLMDGIDGNLFLTMTLLSLSSMENELGTLIESWKNQDMQKIEALTMEGIENENQKDYFDKLYFKRNIAMTEKIKGYLSQNDNYFVIVGSGHLVGEKGILSLLKKAGYTVE